jgi:hypothetical protein
VYAEFENWNQYWNLVWNENNILEANLSGPWPSITMVPVRNNDIYKGLRISGDGNIVDLEFKNKCLVFDQVMTCKKASIN